MLLVVVAVAELARSRTSAIAIEVGASTAKTAALEDTSVRREVAAVDPSGAVLANSYKYRKIKVKLAYGSEEQLRHALKMQTDANRQHALYLQSPCDEPEETDCPPETPGGCVCPPGTHRDAHFCWHSREQCSYVYHAFLDCPGDETKEAAAICAAEKEAANRAVAGAPGAATNLKTDCDGNCHLTSSGMFELEAVAHNETQVPTGLAFRDSTGSFYFDESTATFDKACRPAGEHGKQGSSGSVYACADPAWGKQRDLYDLFEQPHRPSTSDLKTLCSTAPECEYTNGALSSLLQRLGMESARINKIGGEGSSEDYEAAGGHVLWRMMVGQSTA